MELSTARRFETERMARIIDAEQSIPALRSLCRQLAQSTAVQAAAAERISREAMADEHRQAMEAARARACRAAAAVDCGVL